MKRIIVIILLCSAELIRLSGQDIKETKEINTHFFRDISQMEFSDEKKAWGDIEHNGVTIEVTNFAVIGVPGLSNIYEMKGFSFGQVTPIFTMMFKYHKQDVAGNYIYYCIFGNTKSTGEFTEHTIASISLQCSEKLDEMAKGKNGYLTTIILEGTIVCYICQE